MTLTRINRFGAGPQVAARVAATGQPSQHEYVSFAPVSDTDATTSGVASVWMTLGNVTAPDWATEATITMTLAGIYEITSAPTQYVLHSRIGLTLGTRVLHNIGAVSRRETLSWVDRITLPSTGALSVQVAVFRAGGAGQWRADVSSDVRASVVFT